MVASTSAKPRSEKANKVRAILAGGLVLGVGAAFTLAAWTDNEWVFGQGANGGGPGTLNYNLEQNTFSNTNGTGPSSWGSKSNIPTVPDPEVDGALTFGALSASLKPGDTTYAPMQLRAAAGSEGLVATLSEGVKLGGQDVDTASNSLSLYNALTYQVVQKVDPLQCAAGNLNGGESVVGAGNNLTTTSPVSISLPKGDNPSTAGAPVDLCFALTLPATVTDTTLQGKKTVPLWKFSSTVGVTPAP